VVLVGIAGNDGGGEGNGAVGDGDVEDEELGLAGDDVLGTVCPASFVTVMGLLIAVI
jgi:hypothetical protein